MLLSMLWDLTGYHHLHTVLFILSVLCISETRQSIVYLQITNDENIFSHVFGKQTELSTFPQCLLYHNGSDDTNTIEVRRVGNITAQQYEAELRRRNISALNVEISLSILQLLAVSEKEQTMTMGRKTHIYWSDCRLAWSAVDFNMVNNITIQPERFRALNLFVPPVILIEETNTLASQGTEMNIRLSSTGEIKLHREYASTISCFLDVSMYPFDTHLCNLTFETPFNSLEVNLTYTLYNPVEAESRYLLADGRFIPSDTWEVVILPPVKSQRWVCSAMQPNGHDANLVRECLVDRQTFRIVLRRHPDYQVVNLLVPAFLCLIISTCIFMIPPGATDKLFLMLTILLSLFLFLNLMYDKMPETGSTLPWASK